MLKLLKVFGKLEWFTVFIIFWLIFGQVWLDLKLPDYMQEITVLVQTEGSKMHDILLNGGYMLLCAFGSLLLAVGTGYLIAGLSAKFSLKTRKRLFDKVLNLGLHETKSFQTSSLITRTTNDITQVEMLIGMGLQMLIKAPITAIWAITKILNKSTEWSMLTAVAVGILLLTIGILTIIVMPRFKIVQKLTDKINGVTRENLNGIRVVRAFNAEDYQEGKFDMVNTKLTKTQMFNQRTFAVLSPIMYLVMYYLTLSIYFVGAYLIKDSLMADKLELFGNMIVFSSYAMQVIMAFLMLAMIFMLLPRAQVSAKRINEVLNTKESITYGKLNHNTTGEEGTVEFKNVSFKYPDAEEYLIRNISFKANKGDTVAFIGSTGSGKSTLINLVPRFYDATEGEVLIDGVNVKDYTEEYLYSLLGYVPQKAVMFDGTIKENVTYGKDSKNKGMKEIEAATKVAQAEEFISKMDDGLDSHIARGGTNVSGGQKQRLSIARAIAKDPEIYIFDDSFSALDYKTDATLIVAQRIGTIMNADKIIVLDSGKCVGMGTHKELLKSCEVYKQIALSQLTEEELENE